MAYDIEVEFDEVPAILDPKEPGRGVGFFSGKAEISIDDSGWHITGLYLHNTAKEGEGFVYVDRCSEKAAENYLFIAVTNGLYVEYESSIEDAVNDWHDRNGIRRMA